MAFVERVRGIQRWLATGRSAHRLRLHGRSAPVVSSPDERAAPRPTVLGPGENVALLARLGRWRTQDGPIPAPVAATMTAGERAAAMRDLLSLRSRLDGRQAALIDGAIAAGEVTVRRLGPEDGHLWEMPGQRVFAIVGVQAFTVLEEAPPGL